MSIQGIAVIVCLSFQIKFVTSFVRMHISKAFLRNEKKISIENGIKVHPKVNGFVTLY